MRTLLLLSTLTAALVTPTISHAENCMLLKEADAIRECFDRTFTATSKAEQQNLERSKDAPKLAPPPKTQGAAGNGPPPMAARP